MSIFLVVYTAAGLIGAVSYPLPSKVCEQAVEDYPGYRKAYPVYTFKCEEHKSRPKVQTKIDHDDRERFESNCRNYPLPLQCEDMPNGDINFLTTARDKHGKRIIQIEKFRDLYRRTNANP